MKKLFAVLAAMLLLVTIACSGGGGGSSSGSSDSNETDSISSTIGTSGGEIKTRSGYLTLTVPAGALVSDTRLTISLSDKETPPGNLVGVYALTPNGQTFNSPVMISIKYDPDSIPEGVDPSELSLAYLSDSGDWEEIPGSIVDTTNHIISGQTNHFSTYSAVSKSKLSFGTETGQFNSVVAYSNGSTSHLSYQYNSYDSYNTGMKWQCVEYVNRYYKQIYGKEIRIAGRDANDYYKNASARGLVAYANDSSEPPRVGDILVSENGKYGHVAVVREVYTDKIYAIQQNWFENAGDNKYQLIRSGNHVYPFDGIDGTYKVKGWVRTNANATFSINGKINGTVLSGVTVNLTGAANASRTTDAVGNYSFTGLSNGNYTVTPTLAGYSFSPSNKAVTISGANQTNINFTATVNSSTYSMSGTIHSGSVSGPILSGATLSMAGQTATSGSDGTFSITGIPAGTHTFSLSKSGYNTYTNSSYYIGSNQTGLHFYLTATSQASYNISGVVTLNGSGLPGVTVTLTGASSVSTTTDSSGNYSFNGAANGSYTITPSKAGYNFSPSSKSVTVNNANITGQNFTATASTAPTYSISGTVNGAVVSSVTITLTGIGSSSTTTDSSGNYSFNGAANGSYTITPSKTGYTFSPTSKSVTVNDANVTGQNFTATANDVGTYTISGKVLGSFGGWDLAISLTGATTTSTWVDGDGNYSFINAANGSYTITPAPPENIFSFSPSYRSITVNGANVTGQNFTVSVLRYSISGKITWNNTGLAGVTVNLHTRFGDDYTTTTDSSGNYSFANASNGENYVSITKTGYEYGGTSVTINNASVTGVDIIAVKRTILYSNSFESLSQSSPNSISPLVANTSLQQSPQVSSGDSSTGVNSINFIPNGNPLTSYATVSEAVLDYSIDVTNYDSVILTFYCNSNSNPNPSSIHNCESHVDVYYSLDSQPYASYWSICGQYISENSGWLKLPELPVTLSGASTIKYKFVYRISSSTSINPSAYFKIDDIEVIGIK